ncbi:methylated-DNA--[protein]-cysteine S-methyltransferase [Desulforamulus ferrireducens]|uniref:Methylated-DNA--protein-cysteine methyltransferase n=1 Tax=Desulforamulus ferrireducens TaxID=1833852 RepID=A0A1S6IXS6_9FIRM|nr:methylated-DNA--[protein]-cysteine S-methyltransferase [Desulforamulus ferrireducens]AQS59588.1 cysteine methyltransferase [Desulforamulus ferrireducens]
MKNVFYYQTELGVIGIADNGAAITDVFFGQEAAPKELVEKETPLIKKAITEIKEYLAGKRTSFDLPLEMKGTDFQKATWQALLTIPYGETRSYKQIAEQIGRPKACRAIGMANNRNPISIIVPCHRVIGANGSLVGYGGGLELKARLLSLEKANKS